MENNNLIQELLQRGVNIPEPAQIHIAQDVNGDNVEPGVTLQPGVVVEGSKTMLGRGTVLGPGGHFVNVATGRGVKLADGYYANCVFLDHARVRGGAEIREGCLFMEHAQAAHTVGCKMTVLGAKVTLGSLINFCDVLVTGGSDEPFGFTEIGSGAIHYNFTPNGLKFGSVIGPGAPGEMYGLFARTFVGGQTQIIAPTTIGWQSLIPAGMAVRTPVASGMISIQPPPAPGDKPYEPAMLVRILEKVSLTANLITHYKVLALYFHLVRQKFAQDTHDTYLTRLYTLAEEILRANIQERLAWLFSKEEDGKRVDLLSKVPQSQKIHEHKLRKARHTQARFHLEQIWEHETLQKAQAELQAVLQQNVNLPATEAFVAFMQMWQAAWKKSPGHDYFTFLHTHLGQAAKEEGKIWLERLVAQEETHIREVLDKAEVSAQVGSPIVVRWQTKKELLRQCFPALTELYRQNKFLVSGNFQEFQMGLLNRAEEYCDLEGMAWEIFAPVPDHATPDLIDTVLGTIAGLPYPAIVSWPDLWGWVGEIAQHADENNQAIEEAVRRACLRFHGTDGLRGRMVYPEKNIALQAAIQKFVFHHEVTPELFGALARNTIYALEASGCKVPSVVIGKDTRDLYADDPQLSNIFYEAVRHGVLTTGITVYDTSEIPIAAIPGVMAYCNSPLGIYKSASHNPASQDGIKLFVRPSEAGDATEIGSRKESYWEYGKALLPLEVAISALIFKEALTKPEIREQGKYETFFLPAAAIYREMAEEHLNDMVWQDVGALVIDLAHGAFAAPRYRKITTETICKHYAEKLVVVGDKPNGRNINNNEGDDRVGAAHLESVQEIAPQEIESGGPFYGFPALSSLFALGKSGLPVPSVATGGKLAWAIFTDGDGDRGYSAFYHPQKNLVYLVDGEKAVFYRVAQAVHDKSLHKGDMVAVTVESSVTFINAMVLALQHYIPVQVILMADTQPDKNKLALKITPVGDKYILANQCLGVESSGHLIQKYRVGDKWLWIGNGLLSMLDTLQAAGSLLHQGFPGTSANSWLERLDLLAQPYPRPYNTSVSVYFVRKKMWYRGSELWRKLEALIVAASPQPLTAIYFPEEPDTMYFVAMGSGNLLDFSILARPSGTENKMSVKLYGTEATQAFFQQLAERVFMTLALSMKEFAGQPCQDEVKLLHYLAAHAGETVSITEIQPLLIREESVAERAYLIMVVEALSNKGDKLAKYDGRSLNITPRGLELAKQLKK